MDLLDLTKEKDKNEYSEKLNNYVSDMCFDQSYESREDYDKQTNIFRKKYKFVPKKTDILKSYNSLLKEGLIEPNPSFYKFSMKKMGKSSSGVSVITILTSPTPEYTNINGDKVKQTFSCGCSCAYCPNEPEIRLNLHITECYDKFIYVSCSDKDDIDNLQIIRVLSYLIHNDIEYRRFQCSEFQKNSFKIRFDDIVPKDFIIGEKIIGVKIEQPRSYLNDEPAVLRANMMDFDCFRQFNDRALSLMNCGHPVDKIEIIVLGGTWDHYPLEYQYEFIRDIYYSANIFSEPENRERLSLNEEININEKAKHRIIGLTLETRPDCITKKQIKKFREMNVTRVQLGVQHIDNDILEAIQRDCTIEQVVTANRLLKDNGYKVDWHLMPDLPCSSVEKDLSMFRELLGYKDKIQLDKNYTLYNLCRPELQADQLKIYPCTTVNFTKIQEWYHNKTYKPYGDDEENLIQVIQFIKTHMFSWIRLNRIIRDIPNNNIIGGNKNVNLRQKVLKKMKDEGETCDCIRCREIKGKNDQNLEKAQLFIDEYNDIGATEYFISYCSPCKNHLYGFLRLRINDFTNKNVVYDEFSNYAFIRELHVYGLLVKHDKKTNDHSYQHKGIGTLLLNKAEEICLDRSVYNIAIISGVGVRGFYKKKGYTLKNNYMIKNLKKIEWFDLDTILTLSICLLIVSIMYDLNFN